MSGEVEDIPMLKAKGSFDPLFESLQKSSADSVVI
jgi:hypothetical protein